MRVALLKDPEVRARIVQPLPAAPPPPAATGRDRRAATNAAIAGRRHMTAGALTRPGERQRLIVRLGQIDWTYCAAHHRDRRRRRGDALLGRRRPVDALGGRAPDPLRLLVRW